MRKYVAFACQQFAVSERRACRLLGMDRGSYRYEPSQTGMGRREKPWSRWHDRNRGTDIGDCMRCWSGVSIRRA